MLADHGENYKQVCKELNEICKSTLKGKFQDLKLNPIPFQKMAELMVLIKDEISLSGGRIQEIGFHPNLNECGFTARIGMMDLHNEKLKKFCELGSEFGCITINGDRNDVLFSCSIRNIFIK